MKVWVKEPEGECFSGSIGSILVYIDEDKIFEDNEELKKGLEKLGLRLANQYKRNGVNLTSINFGFIDDEFDKGGRGC